MLNKLERVSSMTRPLDINEFSISWTPGVRRALCGMLKKQWMEQTFSKGRYGKEGKENIYWTNTLCQVCGLCNNETANSYKMPGICWSVTLTCLHLLTALWGGMTIPTLQMRILRQQRGWVICARALSQKVEEPEHNTGWQPKSRLLTEVPHGLS